MSGEEEFQLCPNCKVGRLRPTGLAATSSDPQTNRVTNDLGYKCDSCGYPEGGQAKVVAANEQAAISESTDTTTTTTTTTTTSTPAATTAAVQSAVEAVGAVVVEDKDKGKDGTEEEASYTTSSPRPSGGSSNENPA
jgi:hypothetical protein